MTFSAYDDSASGFDDYTKEEPLDQRMAETGKPLMVMMGAEEQIIDEPAKRLAEYRATVPGTRTKLISRRRALAKRRETGRDRALVLGFAPAAKPLQSQIIGLNCKSPCRSEPSCPEAPLESNPCSIRRQISLTTPRRRRRPPDRLRDPRRVRARAAQYPAPVPGATATSRAAEGDSGREAAGRAASRWIAGGGRLAVMVAPRAWRRSPAGTSPSRRPRSRPLTTGPLEVEVEAVSAGSHRRSQRSDDTAQTGRLRARLAGGPRDRRPSPEQKATAR